MSAGRSGERFERTEYVYASGPGGAGESKHIAEFLPHVQANVCSTCNNGWMATMEVKARDLLDPVMASAAAGHTVLDGAAQTLLAAWFSKCVYGYAAAMFGEPNRPWSAEDYGALRETHEPSARATVWAGASIGSRAGIGLSLTPLFLTPLAPDAKPLTDERPAMASAWLSANGTVFYGLWMPPEMVAAGLPERLAGAEVRSMMRIWPPSDPTIWPSGLVSDDETVILINLLATLRDEIGIPVDSLAPKEVEDIKAEMRAQAAAEGRKPTYAIVNRLLLDRPDDAIIEGEYSPWPEAQRNRSQIAWPARRTSLLLLGVGVYILIVAIRRLLKPPLLH